MLNARSDLKLKVELKQKKIPLYLRIYGVQKLLDLRDEKISVEHNAEARGCLKHVVPVVVGAVVHVVLLDV